jgi:hypothetical protein
MAWRDAFSAETGVAQIGAHMWADVRPAVHAAYSGEVCASCPRPVGQLP